jgi:hypothetical protein
MLYAGATLGLALQVDTQIDTSPPFWWIGLFASPGGLLIVAGLVAAGLSVILFVRRDTGDKR